jgi:protein-L-isoaspartate(D-aspartate) O-methyltransferase
MRRVDRALFVPSSQADEAYADSALPVQMGQTISQPYIVGLMTETLEPMPGDRVLEIGCGTGYQTAVLAGLVREVWSVEIVPELAESARRRMQGFGCENVHIVIADGWKGLPDRAPFDKIIVTAAPEFVPEELLRQLAVGGIMVVPVGVGDQTLLEIRKTTDERTSRRAVAPVRFVPMIHGGECE